MTPEEIDALKAAYEKRDDDPLSTGESYIAFHNAAEGQMPALLAAVEEVIHLRAELARVTAERDEANEALTVAYLAGAERGKNSAFAQGRRAGLEAAAGLCRPKRDEVWTGTSGSLGQLIEGRIRALIDHPAADAESEAKQDVALDAARYRWLRTRDLDMPDVGGIFIAVTPHNLVIDLEDADRRIDEAMAAESEARNG